MPIVTTQGSKALVRSGPGSTYGVVGSRSNGDTVEVLEKIGAWARIGTGQWMSETLLKDSTSTPTPASDVSPHPSKPNNPRWRLLINFPTGSAELRPAHRKWLLRDASSQARSGQHIWLRGLASRLGESSANDALSKRRANAVRDYLIDECKVSKSSITGVSGVGESWSSGSGTDNSGKWRAVEVIITNNTVELPAEYIGGDSPLSKTFFLKFTGGGGGGEAFELQNANFIIRTPKNYWQKYTFFGVGLGFGAPVGWGDASPRGEGWVEFKTNERLTVRDFAGMARVSQAGVQVGAGISYFSLVIPYATDPITVPSGSGLSIGLSWTPGKMSLAGTDRHDRNWDNY
jgi:outer membrane protein OmpA-like peptidoglycan-associated protein